MNINHNHKGKYSNELNRYQYYSGEHFNELSHLEHVFYLPGFFLIDAAWYIINE